MMTQCTFVVPFRPSESERNASWAWFRERLWHLFPGTHLRVGDTPHHVPFNRSAARNDAARRVSTPYLFIADSDTVFNKSTVEIAVRLLDKGAPWVIPFSTYYRMDQRSSRNLMMTPPDVHLFSPSYSYDYVITEPPAPGHDSPQAGLLAFRTEDFLRMGGYCETFRGWGWEDRALVRVADGVIGQHERGDGEVYHIWHPEPQELTWQQPDFEFNKALSHRFDMASSAEELLELNGPI